MHDTSDACSFRHQGTHPPADQRSPSATVRALGSASADAATVALIAPARTAIRLTVNGVRHRVDVADRWPLVALLRDQLELTGTTRGCDRSECGTGTVLRDGQPVYACSHLAV
jgi:xanthine dehydrogenase YagT iron-sulfur-binding subunit